jgi:hypothetical protein
MIRTVQEFTGSYIMDNPTAEVDSDGTVRLETPQQWYDLKDLKGYIKFLKDIKRQVKAAQV